MKLTYSKDSGASNLRVLIFVDNASRDLLGVRLLQEALSERGCEVSLCNLHDVRGKLVGLMPHVFVAARGDMKIAQQASKLCKVYVVPGEGGAQTRDSILTVFMGRAYWKMDSVEWISKCYLWSKRTEGWLLDTGMFNPAQLAVVGGPRLDVYADKTLIEAMSKRSSPNKFRIGVAFSAKSTSAYYGDPHFAEVYFDMGRNLNFPVTAPNRYFEDIVWRDHAILRHSMQMLKQILETMDCEVWFRSSPFESASEYRFLEKRYPGKVRIADSMILPEFICGVDVLLTCWSTVGLEAMLLKKPVISIAGLIDQEHLFNHISAEAGGFDSFACFYHRPRSDSQLLELLGRAARGELPASTKSEADVNSLLKAIYEWDGSCCVSDKIAGDICLDANAEKTEVPGRAEWKKVFPIRLPSWLFIPLARIKMYWVALRCGHPRSYLNFVNYKNGRIDRLVREYRTGSERA